MSSPSAAASEDVQVISVVPILRMFDVAATIRFYVEYLGCSLDPAKTVLTHILIHSGNSPRNAPCVK